MKPAAFDYFAPGSLEEVVAILDEHRGSVKILAGGQSLVPLMAFRLARPSVIVDLRNVEALRSYAFDDGVLTMGAMVTHRTVELDERVTTRCAMVHEALKVVGHVGIRNVGTVGGSLAHADPTAEWPALALALDAEMTVVGTAGTRVIQASDFVTGWMTTSMQEDEVLSSVKMQLPARDAGSAFEEVARRHGDFAIVGAAAVVSVEGTTVTSARIALAGASSTAIRVAAAESVILGASLSEKAIRDVGEAATSESDPIGDLHGSVDYKRQLVAVLTRRVVRRAYERAQRAA